MEKINKTLVEVGVSHYETFSTVWEVWHMDGEGLGATHHTRDGKPLLVMRDLVQTCQRAESSASDDNGFSAWVDRVRIF